MDVRFGLEPIGSNTRGTRVNLKTSRFDQAETRAPGLIHSREARCEFQTKSHLETLVMGLRKETELHPEEILTDPRWKNTEEIIENGT